MAVGGWRLAVGGWRLAVGGWRLTVGGPWGLSVGSSGQRDGGRRLCNKMPCWWPACGMGVPKGLQRCRGRPCAHAAVVYPGGGGGGWHKAWVSDWLPLAAPIGLSPLLILTLCGPERVLVVSTEPPDDLSCLTTPEVGCPGDVAYVPVGGQPCEVPAPRWPHSDSTPPARRWGGGVGTRPRYSVVCLWRRLLASRHCSF